MANQLNNWLALCLEETKFIFIFVSTMRQNYNEHDVRKAVANSKSIAGVLRLLNLRPVGGNYKTIRHLIEKYSLDTRHFTGQGWNVGLAFKPKTGLKDSDIFKEDSNYRCSWRLRERYKRITGISSCEKCGRSEWLSNPIPLEIHHLNGNNTDNRIENLQLLCPNCHAQTDYYRGRARRIKSTNNK